MPLGAYSAFEPLGGILCTNLPIIWHMWRKRRPLLPGSSAFKSHPSTTATPGSGESRRSRIARSLGLSNIDQTGTDSQSRTILGNEEEGQGAWVPEMQDSPSQPARAQFFGKVERSQKQKQKEPQLEPQIQEVASSSSADNESPDAAPKKHSLTGPSRGGPKSPQGMRKNVWEVRKK